MTRADILKICPQASEDTIRETLQYHSHKPVGGLDAAKPQQNQVRPLERKPSALQGGKSSVLVIVTFVPFLRRGPRPVDEDNFGHSQFKSMRDQIAERLGIDDGDPRIRFEYAPPVVTKGKPGTHVTLTLKSH